MHGCDIVITNIGGPKEYYPSDMVQLVNPYDTDDIGQAVLRAMEDTSSQPKLRNLLEKSFNVSYCTDLLIHNYSRILK
jgi:glycosyltransferase involved in cell wall biosynthesis